MNCVPPIRRLRGPVSGCTSRIISTSKGALNVCTRDRSGHVVIGCGSLSPSLIGTLVTARSIHFTGRDNVSTRKLFHTIIGENVLVRGDNNNNDAVARRLTGRLFSPDISGIVRHLFRGPVR